MNDGPDACKAFVDLLWSNRLAVRRLPDAADARGYGNLHGGVLDGSRVVQPWSPARRLHREVDSNKAGVIRGGLTCKRTEELRYRVV